MRRHGGRTGELGVGVHTAHGVGHAVRGRAGAHVVRVQGTASAATRSDGEVLLASLDALLLVGASDGVLEARGVGGVTGDRDVDVLVPHDGNALADVVGAVAVNGSAGTIGVGDGLDDLEFARVVVELGLHIGEAVDAGDDLSSVLAQTVEDDAQRLLTSLVGVQSQADGALSGSEGLVAGQEGEALGVVGEQHSAQVAVAQTDLAVLGDGAGNGEGLDALADDGSSLRSGLGATLDSESAAEGVGPLSVLEGDGLGVVDDLTRVEALVGADLQSFLEGGDAVVGEALVDLVSAALVTFERNSHSYFPPFLLVNREHAGDGVSLLVGARVDVLGSVLPLTIVAHSASDGLLGGLAGLDGVGELAEVQELERDDLVLVVESHAGDVALSELEVTSALGLGAEHGADLRAKALAEVVEGGAHGQAALGERGLAAAVNDLQEDFAHSNVDGVADEVGVEGLEDGLTGKDLGSHGGRVGHARAADGLNEGLLDDAVLDVQRELAGALLRCAPTHTVRKTGDVGNLLSLDPLALLGDGCGAVVCTLGNGAHVLHFL